MYSSSGLQNWKCTHAAGEKTTMKNKLNYSKFRFFHTTLFPSISRRNSHYETPFIHCSSWIIKSFHHTSKSIDISVYICRVRRRCILPGLKCLCTDQHGGRRLHGRADCRKCCLHGDDLRVSSDDTRHNDDNQASMTWTISAWNSHHGNVSQEDRRATKFTVTMYYNVRVNYS